MTTERTSNITKKREKKKTVEEDKMRAIDSE